MLRLPISFASSANTYVLSMLVTPYEQTGC